MHPTFIHQWFEEVWNQGDESAIFRLMAADAVVHNFDQAGGEAHGSAAFAEHFKRFRSAFPDLHVTIHHAFEHGGYTAGRWTATGTHTGDGLGFAPTQRKIEIAGMSFGRMKRGQVVEAWDSWDAETMMRQLGQNTSASLPNTESRKNPV